MAEASPRYWQAATAAALLCGAVAVVVATNEHSDPERCPTGLSVAGPRCCGGGQQYTQQDCNGIAQSCSSAQITTPLGCDIRESRIALRGGELQTSVDDWDLQDRVVSSGLHLVAAFGLDRFEVTGRSWAECAASGACAERPQANPNWPITEVSVDAAARYCAFRGGRLPTSNEWLWAARGSQNRRYPWGAFGLVCRRAVFGLVAGPCASNGVGPEVPGSRPDGATPDGVYDLAGNVAEWTLDAPEAQSYARGGSYRSTLAAELKTLGAERLHAPAPDVGFRCAYPL